MPDLFLSPVLPLSDCSIELLHLLVISFITVRMRADIFSLFYLLTCSRHVQISGIRTSHCCL